MVIATVIITVSLMNAIFPSILSSSDSIKSSGGDADDRASTSLAFINYEVVPPSETVPPSELRFDVLNNGRTEIQEASFPTMTVYLAEENAPLLLVSGTVSETELYWGYTLTGGDAIWGHGETLVLQVHDPAGGFAAGNYRLRLQLSNGAMCEQAFTV
jgi:flagellar protein FlaG